MKFLRWAEGEFLHFEVSWLQLFELRRWSTRFEGDRYETKGPKELRWNEVSPGTA